MRAPLRLAVLAAALAAAPAGRAADLSPEHWPAAERARVEAREAALSPAETRMVQGRQGLVAGTASPIAVRAGMEALRQGGTAADAAAATALTQVTTMLGANVSFAGVVQLLYFDARTGRVHVMDAGWNGWRGEQAPATIPDGDLSALTGATAAHAGAAGRRTLVPGFMAGIEAMHRRFGRLSFRDLFAPSIWYARHGVPITPLLGYYFAAARAPLTQTPAGRRFALPDGVNLPAAGQRFVPPGLEAFLRAVAGEGARHMYRGAWARRYVAAVRAAGGSASPDDLAAYRPRWAIPLRTGFDGATVFGPASPNSSGCAMLGALNLIDHVAPGGAYWQDAQAFRTLALAVRAATIAAAAPEAAAALERQATGHGGSCEARLSPEFGAAAAPAMEALLGGRSAPDPGHHSAAVVAIDRWGNVAALVHSSNTLLWGDSGMIVDGVPIPLPAPLYRRDLARMAPGERVPTDMAPLIVLRDGRPSLAIATIGSSVTPETVRLVAMLARGDSDAAAAMAAPPLLINFEQTGWPAIANDELVPAGRYPSAFLDAIRATGLTVREIDAQRVAAIRGTAVIGRFQAGTMRSVEVPGVLGFAEAE